MPRGIYVIRRTIHLVCHNLESSLVGFGGLDDKPIIGLTSVLTIE
jgi:hypothetical protein